MWLKKLNVLHECLAAELNQLLIDDAPRMTNRCLHSTDPEGGSLQSNYRPKTCLSTTWKRQNRAKVNQLRYMDDIKLYARSN